jgi:hypothetical protein
MNSRIPAMVTIPHNPLYSGQLPIRHGQVDGGDRTQCARAKVVLAVQLITHQEFLQINLATHLIDRACVGRCFSCGNYEPSTQVFRLRANGPNAAVMNWYGDSLALQFGDYRAAEKDLPLLQAQISGLNRPIRIKTVQKGDLLGVPRRDGNRPREVNLPGIARCAIHLAENRTR